MTRRINLISVPHSGTHSMQSWFVNAGWDKSQMQAPHDGDGNTLYVCHPFDNLLKDINALDYPTVSPMRHPYLVCESWQRRHRNIPELISVLNNWLDIKPEFCVPVDNEETRQHWADFMCEELNLDIDIHWEVLGTHRNTHLLKLEDAEPCGEIQAFYAQTKSFWDRYY